jgi:hypothetical protein
MSDKQRKVVHVSSRYMNTSQKKLEKEENSSKLITTKTNLSKQNSKLAKVKTVQPKYLLNTSSTSFLNTSSQIDPFSTSFLNSSKNFENEKTKRNQNKTGNKRKREESTNTSKRIKIEPKEEPSILNFSTISEIQNTSLSKPKKTSQDKITELFILENRILQMEFMNQKLNEFFSKLEIQAQVCFFFLKSRNKCWKCLKEFMKIKNSKNLKNLKI